MSQSIKELQLKKARLNIALAWGKEGVAHYKDELGFDFEFERDTGLKEVDLWSASKAEIRIADNAVQEAVSALLEALNRFEVLTHTTNFYFASLKEYWLMNFTFEENLEMALDSIVVEAYDSFRMNGRTFEESETLAELCEKEAESFLADDKNQDLFDQLINLLAG